MARMKKPGTPITARNIEALNAYRDGRDRMDKFWEFWAIYTKLSSEAQQPIEHRRRFLANKGTKRLTVIVDITC